MNNWVVAKKTINNNNAVIKVVSEQMGKANARFFAESQAYDEAENLNLGDLVWTTEDNLRYGVNVVCQDDVLKMFICKDVVITSEIETIENVMVEKTISTGWFWKSTETVMEIVPKTITETIYHNMISSKPHCEFYIIKSEEVDKLYV